MTEKLISLTAGSLQPAPAADAGGARQLKKACEDMESLFVHQLIKEMRATVPKSDLFGKSHAQDIYTGMLDGQMAQEIARNRGLGFATLLMRQLGVVTDPPGDNTR